MYVPAMKGRTVDGSRKVAVQLGDLVAEVARGGILGQLLRRAVDPGAPVGIDVALREADHRLARKAGHRWVQVPINEDTEAGNRAFLDYGSAMFTEICMGTHAWFTTVGKKGAQARRRARVSKFPLLIPLRRVA